jgi:hypothetical protein
LEVEKKYSETLSSILVACAHTLLSPIAVFRTNYVIQYKYVNTVQTSKLLGAGASPHSVQTNKLLGVDASPQTK